MKPVYSDQEAKVRLKTIESADTEGEVAWINFRLITLVAAKYVPSSYYSRVSVVIGRKAVSRDRPWNGPAAEWFQTT
jgi:hypothetical protein